MSEIQPTSESTNRETTIESTPQPQTEEVVTSPESRPSPTISSEEANRTLEEVEAILGSENVSAETREQIERTIAEENELETEEEKVREEKIKNAKEQERVTGMHKLYNDRINRLSEDILQSMSRLRSVEPVRDQTANDLQKLVEESAHAIRGMEHEIQELSHTVTPEKLATPEGQKEIEENMVILKRRIISKTEEMTHKAGQLRNAAQRAFDIDRDHPINKAAFILKHFENSLREFSVVPFDSIN